MLLKRNKPWGDVEVDHDESDCEVDVSVAPDAFQVREDVSDQGRDPSQGSVHAEVVEHVVHLLGLFINLLFNWFFISHLN